MSFSAFAANVDASAFTVSSDFKRVEIAATDFPEARTAMYCMMLPPFAAVPANAIAKRSNSAHQLPISGRGASCQAAMPDWNRFANSGNFYPSIKSEVEKVKIDGNKMKYQPFVYLAAVIVEILAEQTEAISAAQLVFETDLFARASALQGSPIAMPTADRGDAYYAVFDTLRDLEHFGVTFVSNPSTGRREAKKSMYVMQPAIADQVKSAILARQEVKSDEVKTKAKRTAK